MAKRAGSLLERIQESSCLQLAGHILWGASCPSPKLLKPRQQGHATIPEILADCKRGQRKGATSKTSKKSVKECQQIFFDTFRHVSRRAKNVKNRQKVSNISSTFFGNLRVAPVLRPLLRDSDRESRECLPLPPTELLLAQPFRENCHADCLDYTSPFYAGCFQYGL